MIPVQQTNTSVRDGNCFQACVASIFELPLNEVPYFLDGANESSRQWTREQWAAVRKFAAEHGTEALWIPAANTAGVEALEQSQVLYIATGPPPNHPQHLHCVVMQEGKFVHDPSPGGSFLAGPSVNYIFFVPQG